MNVLGGCAHVAHISLTQAKLSEVKVTCQKHVPHLAKYISIRDVDQMSNKFHWTLCLFYINSDAKWTSERSDWSDQLRLNKKMNEWISHHVKSTI